MTDGALATAVYLLLKLHKPLLLEGDAGVGKTTVAKVLAKVLDTELIRLQCYEGLDVMLPNALKRRCLYHWIDYPDKSKELKIVQNKLPDIETELATGVVNFIQATRQMKLSKPPGVAQTLDWAIALLTLGKRELDSSTVQQTIGCILKSKEDIAILKSEGVDTVLSQVC